MRRLSRSAVPVRPAIAALILAAATACSGTSTPAGSPPSSAPPPAATPGTPASPTASGAVADCAAGDWQSAPVSVSRQVPVPPVPVVTAVRTATHPECGYDRVVLDITGPNPGYTIRYVTRVIASASGQTITVPGHRHLLISVRPAQAHADSGGAAISGNVHILHYPMLAGWALAGDFEGVVTLALGLQRATSIRVGELSGRLYIDVKH